MSFAYSSCSYIVRYPHFLQRKTLIMLGEERTTQYIEGRFNVVGNTAAQVNIYESRKNRKI